MTSRRVGAAAALIGVESHVLRHWEDVGVLVPSRSATGHRLYDDDAIALGLVIRRCQHAGLSLAQIRALRPANRDGRHALIEEHRSRIERSVQQLQAAERFLGHLLSCRHDVISDCPDCSAFASGSIAATVSRAARATV
jgi:DNA-binding transcriptional MerR regulator